MYPFGVARSVGRHVYRHRCSDVPRSTDGDRWRGRSSRWTMRCSTVPGEMPGTGRWTGHMMGPVASWPAELRSMVRVVWIPDLAMSLHWGTGPGGAVQRRVHPDHGVGETPAGVGSTDPGCLGRAVGRRDRSADAASDPVPRTLGLRETCCSSWTATATRRSATSPSPTVRSWHRRHCGGVFNIVTETTGKVLADAGCGWCATWARSRRPRPAPSPTRCRAMLDVLAAARQSVPFAVALLRSRTPMDLHRCRGLRVGRRCVVAGGMSIDGYQDESAVDRPGPATGQGEMLTGLRERYSWRSCPDRSARWSPTRRW